MSMLMINELTFAYEGSYDNVFEHLSARLDTSWRLGLTGRNGRGKTTLLRLMTGELDARGHIQTPVKPVYFPFPVADRSMNTKKVLRQLAPEAQDWQLMMELGQLEVDESVLSRPFATLSNGEQTKCLLSALFAQDAIYPLIDEPTNHLDMEGRALVGDYLSRKDGFLLVSHDRDFLNRAIDHVLALNRSSVQVIKGNYDVYEENLDRQNAYEADENKRLGQDVRRLEQSIRRTVAWAQDVEKTKYAMPESVSAVCDRGYIGAKSAKLMKKAQNFVKRQEKAIEEKKSLLKNVELVGELKLHPLQHPKSRLIAVEKGFVEYDGRTVAKDVRFTVERGQRVALTGRNGCGKSSVIKALVGQGGALEGGVSIASNLIISYVPQDTSFLQGALGDYIERANVDETLLKAILRNMDMKREQFGKDMAHFSAGQKKKVLLAKSLCDKAHLYVWDEPLNYIDVYSRKQLEELIVAYQPTMLLVEHDRRFMENVGCEVVRLDG